MKPHPDNDMRLYLFVTVFVFGSCALSLYLMSIGQ